MRSASLFVKLTENIPSMGLLLLVRQIKNHMRRILKWTLILTVTLMAAIGAMTAMDAYAAHRAKSFCDRFNVGDSFSEAQHAAVDQGDDRHRSIGPEHVSVTYIGFTSFSRYFCVIDAVNGKISGTSVLDD
jgi:hypothetical protein